MSKFRTNKTAVKVTGKLPARALFTPLYSLHCNFPDTNTENTVSRGKHLTECDNVLREFFYRSNSEGDGFISLVNTQDITASVIKDNDNKPKGLVLSLGYVVNVASLLLDSHVNNAMLLKLLDLCRYVAEGDADVVECKIPSHISNHHGYGFRSRSDFRGKLVPWISKRYDRTTFYNILRETYPDQENFLSSMSSDMDYFRYGALPKQILASEIIMFREEWKSGALKNA